MTLNQQIDHDLSHAHELMRQHRFVEAITWLRESLDGHVSFEHERLLAHCRFQAYASQPPRATLKEAWPPPISDTFATEKGVPEIAASALNASTLAAAVRFHGALLVRGLLSEARALDLADGVKCALDACEAWHLDATKTAQSSWYSRLDLPGDCDLAPARVWVEQAGGVWAADSPRMLRELTELFETTHVVDAIAGYFGERPMLSVGKSTLRRVPATIQLADWHQDGAFMGGDIRSLNVWLSLSHCGEDASGLEYLPRRLPRVLPTGSHGAIFDWSVGPGMVEEAANGVATVSPVFAPGDALLFDHMFLHRTGIPKAISKDRYAIESWFFAPSAYPAQQVPLWL